MGGIGLLKEENAVSQDETETLLTQRARYAAIENAPQHKTHVVRRTRVDTWYDEQSGAYIALVPESLTQGTTEESAVKAADALLRVKAQFVLGIEPSTPAVEAPPERLCVCGHERQEHAIEPDERRTAGDTCCLHIPDCPCYHFRKVK